MIAIAGIIIWMDSRTPSTKCTAHIAAASSEKAPKLTLPEEPSGLVALPEAVARRSWVCTSGQTCPIAANTESNPEEALRDSAPGADSCLHSTAFIRAFSSAALFATMSASFALRATV